jgi:ribosome maturation factor RimP
MAGSSLSRDIERAVEEQGLELVELETAGNRARPILRVYVDRPDSVPGEPGVSLEDCAVLSRKLESFLDGREDLSDQYVLEVSSPGIERPLTKARDWRRFAGQEVSVRGKSPLGGRARKLQGELLGLAEEGGEEGDATVRLRLDGGEEVSFPLAEVERANLVWRWDRKPARG